jgi:hypothetical protein
VRAGQARSASAPPKNRTVVVRPSIRARLSYAQWAFAGAVIFWSGIGWAAGLRRTDATTWILLGGSFVALLFPPLFLMRVGLGEDGLLVRNYFRAAYVRWDEVAAVAMTRPPIPSPQRRLGWVLEIACHDGRTLTTGALLNANRQTIAEVAGFLARASEKHGFQEPDDLGRLRLAR